MGGPGDATHFAVIARSLVTVIDKQHNGRAQCFAELRAGIDAYLIGLFPGSADVTLAWAPSGKLRLYVFLG